MRSSARATARAQHPCRYQRARVDTLELEPSVDARARRAFAPTFVRPDRSCISLQSGSMGRRARAARLRQDPRAPALTRSSTSCGNNQGVGRREGGGRARRARAAVEVSTAVALIDYGRRSRALRSVCWPRAVGAPHLPVAALLWQAERARKSPALPGLAAAMRAQSDTDRGRGTRAEGGLDSETLSGTDGCRLAR